MAKRAYESNVNGVMNIYKEKGYTSHDVVAKLRGILKIKKIGHTGTLDPDAEGVLPICIGNATKLCELIMEKEKEYRAELILGRQTDTQDISGKVLHISEHYKDLTREQIEAAIMGFVGEHDQIPPMYSALKVNGQKLYELARQGVEVERKPRKICIYSIEIESIELPKVIIRVKCSKGTYIRTLCNDIGDRLGTYGCMGSLLRTQSGRFMLKDAKRLDEIEKFVEENQTDKVLIPTDEVLNYLDKLTVREEFEKLLLNGNMLYEGAFAETFAITENMVEDKDLYRIYDSRGRFMAVYRYDKNRRNFKPEKMFV